MVDLHASWNFKAISTLRRLSSAFVTSRATWPITECQTSEHTIMWLIYDPYENIYSKERKMVKRKIALSVMFGIEFDWALLMTEKNIIYILSHLDTIHWVIVFSVLTVYYIYI